MGATGYIVNKVSDGNNTMYMYVLFLSQYGSLISVLTGRCWRYLFLILKYYGLGLDGLLLVLASQNRVLFLQVKQLVKLR